MFNGYSSLILDIINYNMFLFSIIRDGEHMQSSCTFRNCLFMLKHYTSVKRPKVNSMFLVLRQKLRDHLQGSLNIFISMKAKSIIYYLSYYIKLCINAAIYQKSILSSIAISIKLKYTCWEN